MVMGRWTAIAVAVGVATLVGHNAWAGEAKPTEGQPAPATTAATQPAAQKVTDSADPDFVRCRRIAVVGSNVRKQRVCRTNAEWARITAAGNETARETVERSQSIMNPLP